MSVVRGGWLVRFVLSTAVLIGLAAMHSLGHEPTMADHHDRSGMSPVTHSVLQPAGALTKAGAAMSVAAPSGCAGNGCAGLSSAPGDSPEHMPGWAVCLAVVGASGAALALAATLLRRATVTTPGGRREPSVAASRGPPARPRLGQRVAEVSVLRI
ncbi:DUF6153 family protein [Micromonospora rifamycinica]|uniref:DUF6153 family protein n=1 Tax=Micromonospora rifamycinica TaxID=291594 RepID=UPI002E2ABF96|nr:DUF6153 family protein [Micromonospora rifamycinica]